MLLVLLAALILATAATILVVMRFKANAQEHLQKYITQVIPMHTSVFRSSMLICEGAFPARPET